MYNVVEVFCYIMNKSHWLSLFKSKHGTKIRKAKTQRYGSARGTTINGSIKWLSYLYRVKQREIVVLDFTQLQEIQTCWKK